MAHGTGNRNAGYVLTIGLLFIIALPALAAPAMAAEITVSPGAGAIQAGISAAANGDVIVLMPGTYYEHEIQVGTLVDIDSESKYLTFRADTANGHGPADTIIDAQGAGRIFIVPGLSSITIDNLTLRNGKAPDGWAGATGTNGIAGGTGSNGGNGDRDGFWGDFGMNGGSGGPGYTNPPRIIASGGDGGSGGAVYATNTVDITSTTIPGCSVGGGGRGGRLGTWGGSAGSGGSIGAVAGSGGSIRFCRLVNNTAVGASVYGIGAIDATSNWWGGGRTAARYCLIPAGA